MNTYWLTIKQLDKQLKEWQTISNKYGRPRSGWVKTLREALSMSVEQLAQRLGLTRARISQLENAEIDDAVTLRTLKETANAMECEFVYAIVPKGNSSLEKIIKTRAEKIANERITRVAHSMALEQQALDENILKDQRIELAKSLAENLNKKLWSDKEIINLSANEIPKNNRKNAFKKLIKNLKKKK